MRTEITAPTPRGLDLPRGLAYASDVFAEFIDRGWDIEGNWTLTLGRSRFRKGSLHFTAVREDATETPALHLPPYFSKKANAPASPTEVKKYQEGVKKYREEHPEPNFGLMSQDEFEKYESELHKYFPRTTDGAPGHLVDSVPNSELHEHFSRVTDEVLSHQLIPDPEIRQLVAFVRSLCEAERDHLAQGRLRLKRNYGAEHGWSLLADDEY